MTQKVRKKYFPVITFPNHIYPRFDKRATGKRNRPSQERAHGQHGVYTTRTREGRQAAGGRRRAARQAAGGKRRGHPGRRPAAFNAGGRESGIDTEGPGRAQRARARGIETKGHGSRWVGGGRWVTGQAVGRAGGGGKGRALGLAGRGAGQAQGRGRMAWQGTGGAGGMAVGMAGQGTGGGLGQAQGMAVGKARARVLKSNAWWRTPAQVLLKSNAWWRTPCQPKVARLGWQGTRARH